MNIWNKVLLGLIVTASLPLFYVAARTLKTEQSWGEAVNRLQSQIQQTKAENELTAEGDANHDGIRQLKNKLFAVTLDRGRVWFDCQPNKPQIDPQQAVTVTLGLNERYNSQNLEDGLILYLFEQADLQKDGRYLGEFKVSGIGEGQIVLGSTLPLRDEQLKRVSNPQGPWTAYETMPADSHEIWKLVDEARIKELLGDAAEEYLKDGKPSIAGDPPEHVIDGRYVRQLRSYATEFYELDRLRTIGVDRIAAAKQDLGYMQAAVADAERQRQFGEQQVARLKADVARIERENKAVADLRDRLRKSLKETSEANVAALAQNRRMVEEITRFQFQALAEADSTGNP